MCAHRRRRRAHLHKNASKKIFSFQAIGGLRGPAAKFLAKYSDLPDRMKKKVVRMECSSLSDVYLADPTE